MIAKRDSKRRGRSRRREDEEEDGFEVGFAYMPFVRFGTGMDVDGIFTVFEVINFYRVLFVTGLEVADRDVTKD